MYRTIHSAMKVETQIIIGNEVEDKIVLPCVSGLRLIPRASSSVLVVSPEDLKDCRHKIHCHYKMKRNN